MTHTFGDPEVMQNSFAKIKDSEIRTDLDGLRVQSPTAGMIYLMDRGVKRWIPNEQTYNNLFQDWNGIVVSLEVNLIETGSPISNGAILAKGDVSDNVYLVENGSKRWVTSPEAMNKYHFAWDQIRVLPQVTIDSIPTADNIS